jgi:Protein of unknown function (DUF4242)
LLRLVTDCRCQRLFFRVLNTRFLQVILGENYEKADSSTVVLASHSRVRYRRTHTASGVPGKELGARYLIERTFPAGALKGLDTATKKKVNANNASVGVRWVQSYANADETKTFCVYEGPSEAAVRKAAELNKLPVDSITEVPVTLSPK